VTSFDDLPLSAVRVLDVVDGRLQGVGRLLADLGAEVIRVEPPGGSPDRRSGVMNGDTSLTFAVRNANKTTVVVDPADDDKVQELLGAADLVLVTTATTPYDVSSIRNGRVSNPRLVIVELTDFGLTGVR
jgi:crotonobetainyl-CoA:carnitine CoA-transferase CaiB-like acyl-CoA transferase